MLNARQGKSVQFFVRAGGLIVLSLFLLGFKGCPASETSTATDQRAAIAKEDLLQKKEASVAANDMEHVAMYLEQLVVQHPDAPECKGWRLQLGEVYLTLGNLEPAYRVFRDYTKLYPNDSNTEEASFQALFTKYKQTVRMRQECDVTEAQKTIKLCKKYLEDPSHTNRRTEVEDIQKTCENRIVNKEAYILDTYLVHGKIDSAKSRLASLKELYLPANAELEPHVMYLECKVARAENRSDAVQQIYTDLRSKYPESPFVKLAQPLAKASA